MRVHPALLIKSPYLAKQYETSAIHVGDDAHIVPLQRLRICRKPS